MEIDFSASSITAGLKTKFIGQNIVYLPVTASTMDAAKEEAKKGAPEGTVVIAGEQTSGRGRLNRAWLMSPDSCIAMSVILYPTVKMLPYLIMVASLAVAEGIKQTAGLKAQIKWPNDVLLDGKKVCGILIENGFRGRDVAYAIIGIGVNVNLAVCEIPDIAITAISLSDRLGRKVSRLEMLRNTFVAMEQLYLEAQADGSSVFNKWRNNLLTLGKRVKVTSPGSVQEGIAESVNPDGSLMLRRPDGSLIRVVAEDVTLRE